MEQAQLRIRARRKFSNPQAMFFTRRGLEQASGRRLAAYKARRFARLSNVADVCCGIGGDLIALSQRLNQENFDTQSQAADTELATHTIGVDNDELTCLFAERNLLASSIPPGAAKTQQIEFSKFDLTELDGLHIDPDRRTEQRTVHGNRFSPNLQDVFARVSPNFSVAVKVAPATPEADYFPVDLQREWIGDRRECKQQVLWYGPATDKPGHRTATYVGKGGTFSQVSVHEENLDQTVEISESIHRYVYEPHPAVLAADLTDFLAHQNGLKRFSANIVYLTSKHPVDEPLLSRFEVMEVVPLSLKKVSEVLRSLNVGQVEIKKRGIETVTASRYSRMRLEGPNSATVILTRFGRARVAVIAKRNKS